MFNRTVHSEVRRYRPALLVQLLAHGFLYTTIRTVCILVLLVCIGLFLYQWAGPFAQQVGVHVPVVLASNNLLIALSMFTLATLLLVRSIHFYFNTFYFWGVHEGQTGFTYTVAHVAARFPADITKGFFRSPLGLLLSIRLGLQKDVLDTFIKNDRQKLGIESIVLTDNLYTTQDLMLHVYQSDEALQTFLTKQGISDEVFVAASKWAYTQFVAVRHKERYWSREALSTVRGLGSEFAFGVPYTLERFTKSIGVNAIFSNVGSDATYGLEHIERIEDILARTSEANVLLVGEPGVGKMDILIEMARRMEKGVSVGSLAGKHVVVLDTERLLSYQENKMGLEQVMMKLMAEAANAGNIILVIDNVPSFIESAKALQVDMQSIIDPYLTAAELHVIATTPVADYHADIESSTGFLRRFQVVHVEEPAEDATVHLLQKLSLPYEVHKKIQFTYAAIKEIAIDADRYIVNGVMPDKAVQLLDEVVVYAQSNGIRVITAEDVDTVTSRKTGVPVGPVTSQERDTLLNLETVLHERIVGQERAIDAIAGVIRRSRAGIQDEQKPIGSFLFLGPTGVGKTECAKALAEVFFKGEENMHRIDMSEFSGFDAVDRLIGSAGSSGILSNMLSEHPYSVILLDEFEKASTAVHDLFLQILDEGVFTDGSNRKVNARNAIIIATSNAGSAQILSWVEDGHDLSQTKDQLVTHLMDTGAYRPELINRFDDVVVFEPLTAVQQGEVARAMLAELTQRMKEKGYVLEVTDAMIDTLVRIGYQPEFGARPMRRAIQEVVEEAIAQKIISGALTKGEAISFTQEELDAFIA